MFFPEGQIRVFLYGKPVDMRNSFDGLYALARHGLQQPRDVLRIECGHLGGIKHSLGLRDRHGRSSYRGRVVVSTVLNLIARVSISL